MWDLLYPDLESFVVAVVKGQPVALARLVQVFGLIQVKKMAGVQVLKKYPEYKKHIHPALRSSSEALWQLYQVPMSN